MGEGRGAKGEGRGERQTGSISWGFLLLGFKKGGKRGKGEILEVNDLDLG